MQDIVIIAGNGFDLAHILLLLAVVVAGAVGLWRARQAIESLRDAENRLNLELREVGRLTEDRARLSQELSTQRAVADDYREKLAAANARREEDDKRFADLAQRVMRDATGQFLQTANETFAKHKEGAKGDLEKLMEPINRNLGEFAKKVAEIEKVRTEDKTALQEQVKAIGESLSRNTAETNKLVTALSAPKGGGRWGETTLRNVMERAGLSGFCDFSEQVNDRTDTGTQRPDVVIRLPGGREIVVDAKVSIDDYLKALDTPDAVLRQTHLKAHARNVRSHITRLGSKGYQDAFSARVDFVALFIPGENFYVAALEHEPDLFDYAASKQVIVVTPSTLLALAKAVAYGWRQEQATENARHAAELGRQLYERLATMGEHVGRVGKALNSTVDHFNRLGASLNSRVLPGARKFQDLQIGAPDKDLSDIEAIGTRALLITDESDDADAA